MTLSSSDYDLIGTIATAALAIVPMIKEPVKKDAASQKNKITWSFYASLGLGLIIIGSIYLKGSASELATKNENRESDNRHTLDSLRIENIIKELDSLGYSYNSNNGNLERKIDSFKTSKAPKPDDKPILNLYPAPQSASLTTSGGNTNLKINFYSSNGLIATSPQDKIVAFTYKNNDITWFDNGFPSHTNKSTIIDKIPMAMSTNFSITSQIVDTLFFYFRIDFRNQSGKKQPPFTKIFWCQGNYQGTIELPEVNEVLFNRIERQLKRKGLW